MTDEQVLVVPTKKLYEKGEWNGFRSSNLSWYRKLVNEEGVFKLREKVENDLSWKQIIPQIIFVYQGKIFFHRISKSGGEIRLHDLYPIFLGGHVNPIDKIERKDLLMTAAEREFEEEVVYKGNFLRQDFVGLVNQMDEEVNQVHVGFVFVYVGDSDDIRVTEEQLEEVGMLSISELKPYLKQMTYWSRLVYPYLKKLM